MSRFIFLVLCIISSVYGMEERQLLSSLTQGRVHPTGRRLPTRRLSVVPGNQGAMRLINGKTENWVGGTKKKRKKKKKKRTAAASAAGSAASSNGLPEQEPWYQQVMHFLGKKCETQEQARAHLHARTSFVITGRRERDEARAMLERHQASKIGRVTSVQLQAEGEIDEHSGQSVAEQDLLACYVPGRICFETFGGEKRFEQSHIQLFFLLLHNAACSGYVPAQIFLADSPQIGITPLKRMVYLMHADKASERTSGEKRKIGELARNYLKDGYVIPLLIAMSHAVEAGTLPPLLDELEKNFPPMHIYSADEAFAACAGFTSCKQWRAHATRWSVRAISAMLTICQSLCEIETPKEGGDSSTPLQKIEESVGEVRELHRDHPRLRTLLRSCEVLLGRAYRKCGVDKALNAYHSALSCGEDETTLVEYLRFMISPENMQNISPHQMWRIEEKIKALLNIAVNYKVTAHLLYAAFLSHKSDCVEKAQFFLRRAWGLMQSEHHSDEQEQQLLRVIGAQIAEKKHKETIRERRETRQVSSEIQQRIEQNVGVIAALEAIVSSDPMKALAELQKDTFSQGLFGLLYASERLKSVYEALLVKIQQAEMTEEKAKDRDRILQELKRARQQFDEKCRIGEGVHAIPVALPGGGGGQPR